MNTSLSQHVLKRIHAEYLEMPGLSLKAEQAQRLFGVERATCKAVLDALVETKFLWMKSDGAYARLIDGGMPRLRPATADLEPRIVATASPSKNHAA